MPLLLKESTEFEIKLRNPELHLELSGNTAAPATTCINLRMR
uniref:Uncharacterized protein n=1 Tax=Arundo donax TaxID=35708 RepID=A0A0A9AM78_ARUDO